MRNLTGGSTAIMCPAFVDAAPRPPARMGPRSSPKQNNDIAGRDTERVLLTVGSTDRHLVQLFHPGINARLGGCLSAFLRVIATHADRGIRCSIPAEGFYRKYSRCAGSTRASVMAYHASE